MTVHITGNTGLTLFLDKEDLTRVGRTLDSSAARGLVKVALRDIGLNVEPNEISAFMGRDSAMVVAMWDKSAPVDWAFFRTDSADIFLAMRELCESQKAVARFYSVDGYFYAAVCEAPPIVAALAEQAARVYRPMAYIAFLEEHNQWTTV